MIWRELSSFSIFDIIHYVNRAKSTNFSWSIEYLALFPSSWTLYNFFTSHSLPNLNPHHCMNCRSCRNTRPCRGTYGCLGSVWAPRHGVPGMMPGWTNPQTLCNGHWKMRERGIIFFIVSLYLFKHFSEVKVFQFITVWNSHKCIKMEIKAFYHLQTHIQYGSLFLPQNKKM